MIVSKGDQQKVTVTGSLNIINQLQTKVQDNIWIIELKKGNYKNADLTFNIVIPKLNAATLEGSGEMIINNFKSDKNVVLGVSGSGNVFVEGNEGCENLFIKIDGSGKLYIQENFINLSNLNGKIIGSGSYYGFNNKSAICDLTIEGSGNYDVYTTEILNAKISGSGNINYKGNPVVTSKISGSGKIINKN